MMGLQGTRNANEPEFDDLLQGVRDKIKRIDELHPHDDADDVYVFIIWIDENDTDDVFKRLMTNTELNGTVRRLCDGIISVTEVM